MNLPTYEEIHVISDLHMGGLPGFQILKETLRLANYIRWVAKQRPNDRVALILNGDVIDTLAEDSGGYVAIQNAAAIVERIMQDPSFSDIWNALAEFVKTPERKLVILIGNHDIELAFPTVQWTILNRLAGEDLSARARVEFSVAGAGYPCMVGNARVFCSHGNEVDSWNFVRYEDLSRAARRINSNRPVAASEWSPNAGTKMVKDVMNEVKRRYAWIDLLKPETNAAVGVLAALDPAQLSKLKDIIPIVGKQLLEKSQVDQRLSADGFDTQNADTAKPPALDQMLGANLLQGLSSKPQDQQMTADEMLREAESNYRDRNLDSGQSQTLGIGQLIIDKLTGVSGPERLRRALLDWLKDDKTFDRVNEDDTFKDVTQSLGDNIDFVITGHTHLERAIDRGNNRYYFNCGTWIRLLRFTNELLKDEASFKPVYDILQDGKMSRIDQGANAFLLDQTSAVRIKVADNGKVTGELLHITGQDVITCNAVQQFTRT